MIFFFLLIPRENRRVIQHRRFHFRYVNSRLIIRQEIFFFPWSRPCDDADARVLLLVELKEEFEGKVRSTAGLHHAYQGTTPDARTVDGDSVFDVAAEICSVVVNAHRNVNLYYCRIVRNYPGTAPLDRVVNPSIYQSPRVV